MDTAHWNFKYSATTMGQTEYATVESVSGDAVQLVEPLQYGHRDQLVGLLTRSVKLYSTQDPDQR